MAGKMALAKRIGFTRFSRWGRNLGRLDVTAARHTDALDGTDEIDVTCSDDVNKGDYIVWVDAQGKTHEHIVDSTDRKHGDDGSVQTAFVAVNSIAELWDDWTDDIRPSGQAAAALGRAVEGTRWEVGLCDVTRTASATLYHQSVRESLAQIADAWQGEIETGIETDGCAVTARRVGLRAARGNQSSPKRFTWTKDIKEITRSVSSENPKTRVYGYGKGVETESGGYGRRLTFEAVNDGLDYVEDADATKIWGHPGPDGSPLPACASYVNEQCEDAAQLHSESLEYLKQVAEPKVSYTASVVDLCAFGRDWEGVGVGDRVSIIDKEFSDEGVRLTGRVSQVERDLLGGDVTVTFGNLSDSMADLWQGVSQAIRGSSLASATYDAVAGASAGWLATLQGALNEQFAAAGTYKVETFELGGVYSNVPLDPDTGLPLKSVSGMWAVNISGRGIRLASGLNSSGQWDWRTFITGSQVSADCINAGIIRGGSNYWNLGTGDLAFRQGSITIDGPAETRVVIDAVEGFRIYQSGSFVGGVEIVDGKAHIRAARCGSSADNYLTTGTNSKGFAGATMHDASGDYLHITKTSNNGTVYISKSNPPAVNGTGQFIVMPTGVRMSSSNSGVACTGDAMTIQASTVTVMGTNGGYLDSGTAYTGTVNAGGSSLHFINGLLVS